MNKAERSVIYFSAAALSSAVVAWVAFQIQQEGIAPAVLFPLFVGAALGGALVAIGRFVRLPGRRGAVCGAVCWGLLAACAQDYIGHRYRLRLYDDELARQPLAAVLTQAGEMRPTLGDHLADRFGRDPFWWTLDLALTAAAAGLATAIGTRNDSAMTPSPLAGEGRVRGD